MLRSVPALACLLLVLMTRSDFAQPSSDASATARLHAFFVTEWDWMMGQNPTWASVLGDRRWNDRWEDLTPAAFAARERHQRDALNRLAAIPRAELEPEDQVSYDVFRYLYETQVEGYQYRWHYIRTNTYDGVQTVQRLADSLTFASEQDYRDWIARLRAFPEYMAQNIALMRLGIQENILLPKVIMRRIAAQAQRLATEPPEQSGFFKPFTAVAPGVPAHVRETLRTEGLDAVAKHVQPAYRTLKEFIEREYLPAAYDAVGIWQADRGDELYAYLVKSFTTTELTPREIHELGLKEVARIRSEMERVKAEVGFNGTLEAFFTHLRTDKKFFYPDGESYLQATRALAKRIDPRLVRVFRTLPRLPYGVEPVPMAIAPDQPAGYAEYGAPDGSRPAYYYVNLYKPESRPKWEMMALALHEAVPGHCLQGSLAQEAASLPEFRKHAGFTAYVEGWALYAESLGDEMGLYDDPYDRFGQLTYQMWRAVRLVVDTGMHAFKWDRDRAIRFFMENAAKTELDVVNEIDRYISWPGQALAYKVGELQIQRLRQRAEAELGDRFDLREFHDVILLSGAMPLSVLDAHVERWIEKKRSQRLAMGSGD